VTLPGASSISYEYQHQPNPSGKGSYSTHLLVEEKTPGDRLIRNSYDTQRRVIAQLSTVGTSPKPSTRATFKYQVTSINEDKTVNGTTAVTDINGAITTYSYTSSQITSISYPQNSNGTAPGVTQEWNRESRYPRSLKRRTDRAGLITDFQYDAAGNLTRRSITGSLTGAGGSETATTSFSYNSNNILLSTIDALGGRTSYSYDDKKHPYNPTAITKSIGGTTISSTQLHYTDTG
jgi:YD repeat-containing protein